MGKKVKKVMMKITLPVHVMHKLRVTKGIIFILFA